MTAAESNLLLVVAAALVRDGQMLVQQRPAGKHHAGLWEFPGGKVEPDESPERALARELAEELGIEVDPADVTPWTFVSMPSGARQLVLLLYRVERWAGEPRALEAAAMRWAAPADLLGLPMPPADVALTEIMQGGCRNIAQETLSG